MSTAGGSAFQASGNVDVRPNNLRRWQYRICVSLRNRSPREGAVGAGTNDRDWEVCDHIHPASHDNLIVAIRDCWARRLRVRKPDEDALNPPCKEGQRSVCQVADLLPFNADLSELTTGVGNVIESVRIGRDGA